MGEEGVGRFKKAGKDMELSSGRSVSLNVK